ncbi:MAG: response regulator [Phycisphaerae bacterium]
MLDRRRSSPRIALGEDDVEMRRVLADRLRDNGYEVVEAENGLALIDAIASAARDQGQAEFDLIVSDIRMPEMTGLRFLVELRKHDRTTPVILVTAFGDAATRADAYRLGAGAVLDKPFELDDFCSLVRQFAPLNERGPRSQAT